MFFMDPFLLPRLLRRIYAQTALRRIYARTAGFFQCTPNRHFHVFFLGTTPVAVCVVQYKYRV